MASKSPTPRLLPIELWHNILQYVRLQPLELDQSTTLSKDFCSRRAVLRQLCLTSRWFLDLARPYLYETIALSVNRRMAWTYAAGARSVFLLVRTLTQDHELRPLIRNLALFLPLSADTAGTPNLYADTVRVLRDLRGLLPHLDTEDLAIFDAVESVPSAGDSMSGKTSAVSAQHMENLVPSLVAALLSMTVKLDRLLLQGLLTRQSQEFDHKIQKLMDQSGANTRPFLPNLKTLQLQADSPSLEGDGGYIRGVSSQAHASVPLLCHPGLQSIHLASNWTSHLTVARAVARGIARLEDMNLTVSTGLASIETIVRLSTGLKSLSVTLLTPTMPLPPASERDNDLNEMLLSRAKTLERFSLDTTLCSAEHTADQLGPLNKVTCLPKLHKLSFLSIEPHLLIDWLEVNTWPRFLSTLPPNLVWLTFHFVPEHGQDLLRIWARSGLGSVLRSSSEKWQAHLPHLRHIHLKPLPFSPRTAEVIKKDLAECGIALTWQHLDRHEDLSLDIARLTIH